MDSVKALKNKKKVITPQHTMLKQEDMVEQLINKM